MQCGQDFYFFADKNMLIGIDIDEVLSETLEYALALNDYHFGGKVLQKKDVITYHLTEIPGFEHVSEEEAIDFFNRAILHAAQDGKLQPVE